MKLTRIIQISYKELCDTLKYLWNDNYNYGLDAPVTSLHPVNRENQFNNTIQKCLVSYTKLYANGMASH